MNAYYAVDRHSVASVVDDLLNQFRSSAGSSYAFALMDLAFDHGCKAFVWASAYTRLYATEPLAQLAAISPALIELCAHDENVLSRQLGRLLRHANGRPMLSFLQTDLTANALIAYWQPFLSADMEDGESYLLRWADTRVVPVLARHLHSNNWALVTKPLGSWVFINRSGRLEQLPMSCTFQSEAQPLQRIVLSTEELDQLLKAGEPDAVIQALYETLPCLLPESQRMEFYEHVAECCELAARHGIDAFPDVVALAAASCLSGRGGVADPRWEEVLVRRDWHAGKFAERLVDLLPQEVE